MFILCLVVYFGVLVFLSIECCYICFYLCLIGLDIFFVAAAGVVIVCQWQQMLGDE